MGQMASILFIVVMFAFLYFFMIRPQRKQQQQHQQMLSKIKRGDKVTTIGRLHGVVDEVNETEKTVTLDCDGIYLVFDLNAVAKISPAEDAQAKTVAPESGAAAESAATSEVESASSAANDNADSEAK
ncbi:preprotein translocase subunit YajC [Lactiplantibacillus plantarum]|uniref:preprotein translocase subunit YajC n=1 Tax=Lactiplantibacillus plantarum TaxID=1590 RepID=UPI000B3D4BC2|nr:preprotein translocase subunit YajC [Lactiplantibacillus plantarum]MCG0593208.1 preprotein translocase subunit YajC [Lactiplantibacillus plantarum]MCG0665241.1 preprotein translocase subunit YajC [Lactiplantibacillus plantarum]MCG0671743.1 preprotein translocase subunit YajC [Lactiplantibacillus plantarum]MCG0813275.1 preprotein translocase subunit YajC [Lactiplantibacillus plantarum]MCG0877741.1 preprotein translocase subunit YajC [Lactiplantibacillus plantarum]